MRLGISTSLSGLSPEKWAKKLSEAGLKSVVFPVDCTAPDSLIDEYVKAASEADLTIAEVGIWRNAISPDEKTAKDNLEYSIKQLLLADRINACCCVNVTGSTGERWDGGYKENYSKETWDKVVKMVKTIIDEARPKNTFLTMEPMPWMIPDGPDMYLNLLEDVCRERFAVHMDIINMINSPERFFFHEEFLEEVFEKLGGKIKSCHLKDICLLPEYTFRLKECAPGEGTFNFEKYVELANSKNPQMPMIIEHLKDDEAYFKSVEYMLKRLKNV